MRRSRFNGERIIGASVGAKPDPCAAAGPEVASRAGPRPVRLPRTFAPDIYPGHLPRTLTPTVAMEIPGEYGEMSGVCFFTVSTVICRDPFHVRIVLAGRRPAR